MEYRHLSNPGMRVLSSAPQSIDPEGPFALFSKVDKVPRVCASSERDAIIKTVQEFALTKLGVSVSGVRNENRN